MKLALQKLCYLVLILPVLIISIIIFSSNAKAQSVAKEKNLKLTVFFVNEKEACNPDGYVDYGREGESQYQKLKIGDINRWKEKGKTFKEASIPIFEETPFDFSLGNILKPRLCSSLGRYG